MIFTCIVEGSTGEDDQDAADNDGSSNDDQNNVNNDQNENQDQDDANNDQNNTNDADNDQTDIKDDLTDDKNDQNDTTVDQDDNSDDEEAIIEEAPVQPVHKAAAFSNRAAQGIPVEISFTPMEMADEEAVAGSPEDAEIVYTQGCYAGGQLMKDWDLDFTVYPGRGRVLTKVTIKVGDKVFKEDTVTAAVGADTYQATVPKDRIFTFDTDGETLKETKAVEIAAVTTPTTYSMTIHDADDNEDYTVYEYKNGRVDAENPINAAVSMTYGDTKDYALKIDTEAKRLDKIMLGTVEVESEVVTQNDVRYHMFRIDPSDEKYSALAESHVLNTAGDIDVSERNAYKLMLAVDSDTIGAEKGADIAAPDAAEGNVLNYDATNGFVTGTSSDEIAEDDAKLGTHSLRFKIAQADNYKLNDVTAFVQTAEDIAADKKGADVTVNKTAYEAEGEFAGYVCTIPLSEVPELDKDLTLMIYADAELDTGKEDKVRTITFEGTDAEALSRVEVLGKGLEDGTAGSLDGTNDKVDVAKKNSLTTAMNFYQVEIKPSTGYEFSKGTSEALESDNTTPKDDLDEAGGIGKMASNKYIVNVTESRKYQEVDESEATATTEYTSAKPISYELEAYSVADVKKLVFKLKGQDKRWSGKLDAGASARNYIVTSLKITVDVKPAENNSEKTVIFQDNLVDDDKNSYAITSSGVGLDEEADNTDKAVQTYYINEDQDLLTFTVTSAVEPAVKYGAGSDATAATTEVAGTNEGNVYTYKIPTKNLDDPDGSTNYIVIDKKTDKRTITVKYINGDLAASDAIMYSRNGAIAAAFTALGNDADNDGKFEAAVDGTNNEVGGGQPNLGDKVSLTITPKDDVTISEVTWTMGEDTGKAVIGKDGKAVIKDLVVKDNIVIDVNSTSPYYVVLTDVTSGEVAAGEAGTTLKKLEDGTYTADYSEKDIKINLFKAGAGSATPFTDVVVKDGDLTAATKAVKDGNVAKIASIHADDWGATLTIEVYKSKNEVYTTTLKVSAASSSVNVVNTETGKAVAEGTPVSMMADSEIKFKIEPVGDANLADLAAQIRSVNENPTSADNAAAQALIENGNNLEINPEDGTVTVQAKVSDKAEGKVLLCVYNQNPGKDGKTNTAALKGGSITLDLTEPLVKNIKEVKVEEASVTNRAVAVNVSAVLPQKTVKKPVNGNLHYIVKASNLSYTGEGKVTFKSGTDLIQVIELTANNGIYDASAMNEFAKIDLVSSYKDEKGADVDLSKKDIRGTISADIEVTLVQSKADETLNVSSPASAYVAGPTGKKTLSTKKAIYETKLSVKKVNSSTVTTGQAEWVIATPQFKDASYHDLRVEFVNTKTGDSYGTMGDMVTDAVYSQFKAGVNTNNDVWVSVDKGFIINASDANKELVKNLGVKIYAGAPDASYAATAVVKLSVKQGIYKIQKDETKAALPDQIYVDAKGNAKAVKIATKLNDGNKNYKPAKSTLTYEITDSTGNGSAGLTTAMKAAISGSKPQISVNKSGSISIKGYKFDNSDDPNANKFYVNVKAADFAGNAASILNDAGLASAPIAFTLTQENQTIKELVVLDKDDKVVDQASLTAEMFKKGTGLKIAAVKNGAEVNTKVGTAITDPNALIPVTFKASGKVVTLAPIDAENKAAMTMVKPGTVKITATTVDGGKGTGTKADTTLTIKGYQNLGLEFVKSDDTESAPDVKSLSYSGGSNEYYKISLAYHDGSQWNPESNYKNVKVSVKGGKFLAEKDWKKDTTSALMGGLVVVSDKSGVATVTLTDSADKSKAPVVYTITNKTPSSAKAPSIKLVSPKKLQASMDPVDLEYQVKASDKTLKNYAGKYVKLAPDYTVKANAKVWDAYDLLPKDEILRIDGDGKFVWEANLRPRIAIKAKIVATVGEMENGEFKALAKDAKLNLSLSGKFNENLSVTGKYTLNAMSASTAKVVVKTDYTYTITNAMNVIKSKQGDDDHTNAFTEYFEIKRYVWNDGNGAYEAAADEAVDTVLSNNGAHPSYATIGLKSGLNLDKILEIQDSSHKDDCVGYISVDNGKYRKDIKITIGFSKDAKLRADDPSIYASKAAVTIPVTIMNGKTEVPVTSAVKVSGIAKAEAVGGKVMITTNANITEKTEVQIKVLPETTAYWANMKESEKGAKIDAAKLLEQYGVPVSFKINVVDLTKSTFKPATTKIDLQSGAYDATHGKINGYQQAGSAGGIGYYTVDIPYTFTTVNGAVASGNDAVKVDAAFAGVPNGKTTEKLINVVNVGSQDIYDANGVDTGKDQNVLRLTVSKKALELADAMDKKANPVIGYNKKVTVPVTVRVTNGKEKDYREETLKLSISVPKKPMTMSQAWTALSEQGIGDVVTRIKLDTAATLGGLRADLLKKAAQIVPEDTDLKVEIASVEVKEELSDDSKYNDLDNPDVLMNRGVAVATIKMTDMKNGDAAKNHEEKTWEYALGYNVQPTAGGTIADLKTAIEGLSLTYNKDTTAASLEKEIKDDPTVKDILEKRRGNIAISVISFVKVMIPEPGTISATIRIRDLITNNDTETIVITNQPITADSVNNFTAAVTAVKTELGAGKDADANTELQAIIQKGAGQETRVKEAILKAAKDAAANDAISIDYKSNADWSFAMATAGAAGKVKFTLKMEYKGRISYVTSEAEIAAASQDKYVVLGNKDTEGSAVKLVKDAIEADADGNDKYDDLTTAIQAKSTEAEVKLEIGKLVAAVVGSANVVGAGTVPDADGTIFGYKVELVESAFQYKAPTKTTKGSLSFNLKIYSAADESVSDIIVVPEGDVVIDAKAAVSATNMTLDELKTEMDALGKGTGLGSDTNRMLVANITSADTKDKAITVITTALNTTSATKVIAASQTGELANVNDALTIEATEATTFTVASDNKKATITNVKVTAKKTTGTEVYSVVTDFVIGLEPVYDMTITPTTTVYESTTGSISFTASVTKDEEPYLNPEIEWSVAGSGKKDATTFANKNVGDLTIDSGETCTSLTVTAKLIIGDTAKVTKTATVTKKQDGSTSTTTPTPPASNP